MTLARLLATGSGRIEFRLQVEGWPYEYVTAQWMTRTITSGTYAGRVRIGGLRRDGIGFEEETGTVHGDLEGKGFAAKVVDSYGETVGASLISKPTQDAFFTATSTAADTTLDVTATGGFSTGDYLHVGTEVVKVTGKTATTLTVTRGVWDTTAQKHWIVGTGEQSQAAYIANKPSGLEGRRVWLYGYGEGDDPQGDGTLIFKGVCASDARLDDDGATWSFKVEPRSHVLKQKFGVNLGEPFRPRGILYTWTRPLLVEIWEHSGATNTTNPSTKERFCFIGFFEDQESFCTALESEIDSRISTFTNYASGMRIKCEQYGERWRFRFVAGSTRTKFVSIFATSLVDEIHGNWLKDSAFTNDLMTDVGTLATGDEVVSATMSGAALVLASQYLPELSKLGLEVWSIASKVNGYSDGLGTVPRGTYGGTNSVHPGGAVSWEFANPNALDLTDDLGPLCIYLDRDPGLTLGVTTAYLEIDAAGGAFPIRVANLDDYDPTYFKIRLKEWPAPYPSTAVYLGNTETKITLTTGFDISSLAGYRQNLVLYGPTYCNLGDMPLIIDDDFSADFDTNVGEAIKKRPWAQSRFWAGAKPKTLSELFAEEAKLLGLFLCSDSDGSINIKPTRFIAPTENTTATIDADKILISESAPTWERAAVSGYVNTAEISTGYNAADGEYKGAPIVIRDVASVSEHRAHNSVKIKPISTGSETWKDMADVWRPLLGYYGNDAATVGVDVPMSCYSIALGDSVTVSSDRIPDPFTGGRGATVAGIVTRRKWDLATGMGHFEIFVSYMNSAGYAPTAYVSAKSLVSGFTYDLTVSTSAPGSGPSMYASGEAVTDHFEAGDKVLVWQWDNAAPTTAAGTVVSVSASTVRVTFGGAFGGAPSASDPYAISFDDAVTIAADDSEEAYAFYSGSDCLIDFTTAITARRYGP